MKNIETNLNYKFKNNSFLNDALRHSSIKRFSIPFERLEFLGDRILGIVSAEYIFKKFKGNEGSMAKMHSAFVCAESCYKVALDIGIDKVIQTAGKHLKSNKTVLADAMEAVLGAVFIDSNYETTKTVILKLWHEIFNNYDEFDQEPKTQLQEISQAKTGKAPVYELVSINGPDHDPEFKISLTAIGQIVEAVGHSRKEAETSAAKIILKRLRKA